MTQKNLIANDHPLTSGQRESLRAVARIMIPASEDYRVPGADDQLIFADVLATLTPNLTSVVSALSTLDALADGSFAEQDASTQATICERFRSSNSPLVGVLVALIAQCYYRDNRVMRSLGMEPRPPFPQGFEVEQGDWSLLDPVRARAKIYRDAP